MKFSMSIYIDFCESKVVRSSADKRRVAHRTACKLSFCFTVGTHVAKYTLNRQILSSATTLTMCSKRTYAEITFAPHGLNMLIL
jgi:hypothetical protein